MDAKAGNFTKDTEVAYRHVILIDIDPAREVTDISSTDEEHIKAIQYAYTLDAALQEFFGWPPACIIDSGNGAHLRYYTEVMPNDEEHRNLVKAVLYKADSTWTVPELKVDTSNFNASRIARLPGTIARKGEDFPGRPHRLSRVLRASDMLAPLLTADMLRSFSASVLEAPRGKSVDGDIVVPPMDGEDRLFDRLSRKAIKDPDAWVPYLLSDLARKTGNGWRIDSDRIGRPLQEAISIIPGAITDFGLREARTVPQLLMDLKVSPNKRAAADLISMTINYPATEFEDAPFLPKAIGTMPAALTGGSTEDDTSTFADYYSDMKNVSSEPRECLIDKIIPEHAYSLIYGPSKAGKSTVSRQMCVCVAMGISFLGMNTKQGKVVYIAYEEHEGDIKRGLMQTYEFVMLQQFAIKPTEEQYDLLFENIKVIARPTKRKDGSYGKKPSYPRNQAGMAMINRSIKSDPAIILVVLDPYACVFDTLNSRVVTEIDRYRGELLSGSIEGTDASVLVVDHSNKPAGVKGIGTSDIISSTSGTMQKSATTEHMIKLERSVRLTKDMYGFKVGDVLGIFEANGRYTDEFYRNIKFEENFGIIALPPDAQIPSDAEIRGERKRGSEPLDPELENKVLNALKHEGPKTAKELAGILNVSYTRIRLALEKLCIKQLVLVNVTFTPYAYSLPLNGYHVLKDVL
jgi:hypothetical protein